MKNIKFKLYILLIFTTAPFSAYTKEIGSVDTKFNLLTPDDSVRIEVFNDPKIEGIACYLSRAQTGGIKGAVGVAEDTSDASLDCKQVGPVRFLEKIKNGESVFKERRSLIFKKLKVVRFCDNENNTIVYLVYSERVIEGSPKNSISAVPITQWATKIDKPVLPSCK